MMGYGKVYYDIAWYVMICYGWVIEYGKVLNDVIWYGMTWYGLVWCKVWFLLTDATNIITLQAWLINKIYKQNDESVSLN